VHADDASETTTTMLRTHLVGDIRSAITRDV
jgi:hypothetical protein